MRDIIVTKVPLHDLPMPDYCHTLRYMTRHNTIDSPIGWLLGHKPFIRKYEIHKIQYTRRR